MAKLKPKLQLSNGYDVDLVQTARLLQWIVINKKWNYREAVNHLGLAKIAVENTASLATAMGFAIPRTGRPTRLGEVMCRIDPYLTLQQTPWILHYNLSASPRHLVWHRMTNDIVKPDAKLTLAEVRAGFDDLQDSHSAYSASAHLLKELSVFFQAYSEGALYRLAYLQEQDGEYISPSTLRVPPVVFGYSLLAFASQYRQGETAIAIEDIATATSSPGRIFLMREADVRAHLERLHRNDVINIENKGHLDQVRFVNPPDPADYLLDHFEDTED